MDTIRRALELTATWSARPHCAVVDGNHCRVLDFSQDFIAFDVVRLPAAYQGAGRMRKIWGTPVPAIYRSTNDTLRQLNAYG